MSQEEQFNLTKTELELTQKQMDKYDDISARIKTWTITLWAAILGWSFQSKQKNVLWLAVFIVLFFWALDAVNKNFRQNYKKRRDEVAQALRAYFQQSSWPADFSSPNLPCHRFRGALKEFFQPHIFLSYFSLILAALVIFYLI